MVHGSHSSHGFDMHAITLSIKAKRLGPASAGTLEVIQILARHLALSLREAKGYVDRCVFDGEDVHIPVEDLADAQRLVDAIHEVHHTPELSAKIEAPSELRFYAVGDAYGEFSNFAPYSITIGKRRWPTSEHYFQAQKFSDPSDREQIRRAKTPSLAARLGRSRKKKLRRDWESARVDVMRTAIEAKFGQHPELRQLLVSTGERRLIEHTDRDDFWGDGGDGSGQNMLGRLLMALRQRLRAE